MNKDFFTRANGTIIENEYKILFNMYLVLQGSRPAYLLEMANRPIRNKDPNIILKDLQKTYPEFKYTIEHMIDDIPHRIYIHINDLVESGNYEIDIAKNLGFQCEGIPSDDLDRVAINYLLNVPDHEKINIYTEVCEQKYNEEIADKKEKLFDKHAKEFGWTVEMEITHLMANKLDYYINLLTNNKLTHEHEELIIFLEGFGSTELLANINVNNYNFKDLIDNKNLLLLILLRTKYDPFEQYYPILQEVGEQIEKKSATIFNNLKQDPIKLLNKWVSEIEKIYDTTELGKELTKSKIKKIIDEYSTLKSQMGGNQKKVNTFTKIYKIKDLPKFVHVSSDNNINLPQMEQSDESFKPNGYYYAKGIEWLQFMIDELGSIVIKIDNECVYTADNVYLFEVRIPEKEKITIDNNNDNNSKILLLDNIDDVKTFIDQYGYTSTHMSELESRLSTSLSDYIHNDNQKMKYINWKKVSEDYGGIEFDNYHKIIEKFFEEIGKKSKNYFVDFYLYIRHYYIYTVFDVNGGVIWNNTNVKINEIKPEYIN
jgi:hypothetical protein